MAKLRKLKNEEGKEILHDPWDTNPMKDPIAVSLAAGTNHNGDVNVWIQATEIIHEEVTQWTVVRGNGNLIMNLKTGEFEHLKGRDHVKENSVMQPNYAHALFKQFHGDE